jgi:hypothetical protein
MYRTAEIRGFRTVDFGGSIGADLSRSSQILYRLICRTAKIRGFVQVYLRGSIVASLPIYLTFCAVRRCQRPWVTELLWSCRKDAPLVVAKQIIKSAARASDVTKVHKTLDSLIRKCFNLCV